MGPIIIFQLLLLSIHEWVPMINPQFHSLKCFNTTSDCCLPLDFYWHIHFISAPIYIFKAALSISSWSRSSSIIVSQYSSSLRVLDQYPCCFIGFIHVINIEISPNIINKVHVIQPFSKYSPNFSIRHFMSGSIKSVQIPCYNIVWATNMLDTSNTQ